MKSVLITGLKNENYAIEIAQDELNFFNIKLIDVNTHNSVHSVWTASQTKALNFAISLKDIENPQMMFSMVGESLDVSNSEMSDAGDIYKKCTLFAEDDNPICSYFPKHDDFLIFNDKDDNSVFVKFSTLEKIIKFFEDNKSYFQDLKNKFCN
jgi:hypothetical protein